MTARRAVLNITTGPNEGDALSLETGFCRLIGRHLSESETVLMDRDGNRMLDETATEIIEKHLQKHAPIPESADKKESALQAEDVFTASTFERGSDIIFADDSISRAHAMVFFDDSGVGIIDLASTNGTFVNSERVSSAILRDGDTINLGNSDVVVKLR